jgi:hypothetical protein
MINLSYQELPVPQRYANTIWVVPTAIFLLLSMSGWGSATPIGNNILVNGNAEAGPGSPSGFDVEPIPGWTTTSVFTVVQYGAPGFPDPTVASAINGGTNFFAGGPATAFSSATQTLDISDLATSIDASALSIGLSADLGGFDGQDDNMTITATFLGSSSNTLGTLSIGPVTEPDRGGLTTLLFRTNSTAIPNGTRSIRVEMDATRLQASYDDSYADNVSLS